MKRFLLAALSRKELTGQAVTSIPPKQVTVPYYKVIVSEHVIEVYEMEKQPYNPHKEDRKDDFLEHIKDTRLLSDNLVLLDEARKDMDREIIDGFERKICRKEERRAQTLRDARNKCRRLALANFSRESYFVTLTVGENIDDVGKMDNEFKNFIKRLKYKYNKDSKIEYLAVREFQQRGAIHYHVLINVKFPLNVPEGYLPKKKGKYQNKLSKKYNDEYIKPLEVEVADLWRWGYVDIEPCVHLDNVGAYLIKYMSKEFDDTRLQGKKAYLSSRGLKQPLTYTGESAEIIINELLKNKKKVFGNEYPSEFLGLIKYKEYNLNRD